MPPHALPSAEDARRAIAEAADGAALSALANAWRASGDLAAALDLARALWADGTDAPRIVAAKLVTKARIDDDDAIWAALCDWAAALESAAVLPAVSAAGARRVSAAPQRLGEISGWITSGDSLTRAAALGFAHGLSKGRHPAPGIAGAREAAAAWAIALAGDPAPAPRRAAADFLVSLATHDPEYVARLIEAKDALPRSLLERLKAASSR